MNIEKGTNPISIFAKIQGVVIFFLFLSDYGLFKVKRLVVPKTGMNIRGFSTGDRNHPFSVAPTPENEALREARILVK